MNARDLGHLFNAQTPHDNFGNRTFRLIERFIKREESQALLELLGKVSAGQTRLNNETYMHHYRRVATGAVFYSLLTGEIHENTLFTRYLVALGHDGIEDAQEFAPKLMKEFDALAKKFKTLSPVIEKIKAISRLESSTNEKKSYFSGYYPSILQDSDLRAIKPADHYQNIDPKTNPKAGNRYLVGFLLCVATDLGYITPNKTDIEEFLLGTGSFILPILTEEFIRCDFENASAILEAKAKFNGDINLNTEQQTLENEIDKRGQALGALFTECNRIEAAHKNQTPKPLGVMLTLQTAFEKLFGIPNGGPAAPRQSRQAHSP